MLAIQQAFKVWRHHLEGAKFPVVVRTDNEALKWFQTARNLTRRQARWHHKLSGFDYKIEYLPGKSNPADALTRRPDMRPDERDNLGQVVIPNDRVVDGEVTDEEEIPEEVTRAMEALEETPLRKGTATAEMERYAREKGKRFEERMGVWYDEEGRMWVPADPKTRRGLVREYHDEPHVGHPGRDKTLELLRRDYVWDGMRKDVEEYVKTCTVCQRTKIFPHKPIGLLQPILPATHPWEEITVDLIVGLP